MALSIKTPENYGYDIAALFGVSPTLLSQAKGAGVTITQTVPGSFSIKHPAQKNPLGTVVVKSQAITLAKNGTIGPGSKATLAAQFESSLNKAIVLGAASIPAKPVKPMVHIGVVGAESPINPTPIPEKVAPEPSASVMKLRDATTLYQPVMGTSPKSVYTVFALYPTVKFAARLKASTLSIRCEGPGIPAYESKLKESLMMDQSTTADGHPYMSAHFEVTPDLARKTIASVLSVMEFDQAIKLPNLSKLLEAMQ